MGSNDTSRTTTEPTTSIREQADTVHSTAHSAHPKDADNIVVGLDNSPSAPAALRWAIEEAAKCAGTVTVVSTFDGGQRADVALSRDPDHDLSEHQRHALDWVARLAHPLKSKVPLVVTTPRATVLDGLVAAAKGARCVVIGRPQDPRLQQLPADLAGRCLCPVMVVDPADPDNPVVA
jgi:K+-sensing histidine kinase KdpD